MIAENILLLLRKIPKIGNATLLKLLTRAEGESINHVDDMIALIHQHFAEKIAPETLAFIHDRQRLNTLFQTLGANLARWANDGIVCLGYHHPDFPDKYKKIVDKRGNDVSPAIIFIKGRLSVLHTHRAIAVIGSRQPTTMTAQATDYICQYLARHHINIVSGLASGCDTLAHQKALALSSPTTAILPQGLDDIYPKENTKLAGEIVSQGGLLISEYEPGIRVNPFQLVARDRLQSALSDATIVLQTRLNGGSMHASLSCLYNHKPLYVVDYKNIPKEQEALYTGFASLLEQGAIKLQSRELERVLQFSQGNQADAGQISLI